MGLTSAQRLGIAASAALLAGLTAAPVALAAPTPALGPVAVDDPAGTVRIMGRNLYLGADAESPSN